MMSQQAAAPTNRDQAMTNGPRGRILAGGARWGQVAGGALLVLAGLSRRSLPGLVVAAAGGALAYHGATSPPAARSIHVEKAVTINCPRQQAYDVWHDFSRLPRFMRNLESVHSLGGRHWHWVVKGPAGRTVEWDAEVTRDEPGRLIAWRSVGPTVVPNQGEVRFADAPGDRGTVVHATFDYQPPAGVLGATLAELLGTAPSQDAAADLRRFKQIMETGEIVTTAGQPVGPGGEGQPVDRATRQLKQVAEAAQMLWSGGRQAGRIRPIHS